MASKKKRKWWEGGILLLILLLAAGLMWIGLSGRERTSHIYAYDESVNIRKEQKLADNGSGGEQTDSRQKETPPPDQEKQQEQPQTPPDPDIPDDTSSEKKPEQKKQDKKTDGADDAEDVNDKEPEDPEEPDQGGEPDGDQSNTSGENDNGAGDNGDNGSGGNNGNGDGHGSGGNGAGVPAPAGTPGPVRTALPVIPSTGTPLPARPVPSIPSAPEPTPIPTASPTEIPTPVPTTTPEPDKPVSLACTWKDKDSLIYGKTIPKDSISVKVTMSSGREITLSPSEYTIAGLKNDALGEHIMTVVYENVSCKIRYTVNNAIEHLELDWPTKDRCYKGEPLEDADITVTVYMVDDTSYDLEDGQYTIQGIDNQKTDVKQSFTITYKDHQIKGTCTFRDRIKTYTDSYYDDDTLDETKTWSESVVPNEVISGRTGQIVEHNGKQYELMSVSVTADGKKKSFSDNEYGIGRVFDIQITRRYELVK